MNVRDIVKAAGGPKKIGQAIGRSHSAVCRWNRVPAEHVTTVARLANLRPEEIRPDVFGDNLIRQAEQAA